MSNVSFNPGFQTAQSKLAFTGGKNVKQLQKVLDRTEGFLYASLGRSNDELGETIRNKTLLNKKSFLQGIVDFFSKKAAPEVIEK